jgi:predicted signal transduction protein with EAL and GGDEF domain
MSFTLYLFGFIVLTIGLALGAHMMHVAPRWIGVGVTVFIGLGILSAVATTRRRDPSE